jgi:hypothetical protein
MQPQLQRVLEEFTAAQERLHQLAARFPDTWWSRRADPTRWSAAECVAHLNLTSLAFLPRIRETLNRGRMLPSRQASHYRRDPVGWLLWRVAGPPVRFRTKTAAAFIPVAGGSREELVAEFVRLQEEQMTCTRSADGLDLGRLRIESPFNPRVHYNLFSCLTILPRHQHRHLWQAEQVLEALSRAT